MQLLYFYMIHIDTTIRIIRYILFTQNINQIYETENIFTKQTHNEEKSLRSNII